MWLQSMRLYLKLLVINFCKNIQAYKVAQEPFVMVQMSEFEGVLMLREKYNRIATKAHSRQDLESLKLPND